jgi:putative Mg2+ transporter-C (MgtC) family protein
MAFNISQTEIDIITKLSISVFLGLIIGLEREFNKSAAGLKTYAIVCLGSAVFTIGSALTDIKAAAGVITGIGFIGAATVFKENNKIVGLTTAALVWVTASIGFIIGLGMYFTAIVSTILVLIILIPIEIIEKKFLQTHIEKGF